MSTGEHSIVELKLDQLTRAHLKTAAKVDDMNNRLLDPEHGLFSKVKGVEVRSIEHSEMLNEVRTDLDKLVDVSTRHDVWVASMERWTEDHERRDNELRSSITNITSSMAPLTTDYINREARKKWTDKVIWLIIAAIITGLLPTVKYMLLDAPADKERLERMEKIMLERDSSERRSRGSRGARVSDDAAMPKPKPPDAAKDSDATTTSPWMPPRNATPVDGG